MNAEYSGFKLLFDIVDCPIVQQPQQPEYTLTQGCNVGNLPYPTGKYIQSIILFSYSKIIFNTFWFILQLLGPNYPSDYPPKATCTYIIRSF